MRKRFLSLILFVDFVVRLMVEHSRVGVSSLFKVLFLVILEIPLIHHASIALFL
jgi:hypothetical protein